MVNFGSAHLLLHVFGVCERDFRNGLPVGVSRSDRSLTLNSQLEAFWLILPSS